MMRAAAMAVAIACVVSGGARADVIYEMTGQTYNAEAQLQGATAGITLTLSDAVLQRGSFNLTEIASTAINTLSGDVADFRGFSFFQNVTPIAAQFVNLQIALTFADGTPSGRIDFLGENEGINLTGTAGSFTGTFGTDADHCSGSLCTVAGTLAQASVSQVPEPTSAILLACGLLGLGVWRRNATASAQ